ncbi:uncharacterized protein B0H18DRAFT_1115487 [Fomitopsis serialis]|uniref:uncharacterized protein n=1 Tax=Fomitopsis serialis TaxID=139415 RepID=UPI00200819FB|nr:uncharacterized protein B0H18DRAFT_1115487 [Neoantrodia serialis]KAH9933497.1 hypothetical protein B0H18DRAFT_1115487 [Neoantrodia serialis]
MASNVRACFRCRHKKIKCDIARPTCQNCLKANTPGDCIYGEDAEYPNIRLLEEKIGLLQGRIAFLESTPDSQPIMLHHPYPATGSGSNATEQVDDSGRRTLPPATVQELIRSFSIGATGVGLFLYMPRLLERIALPLATQTKHGRALMNAIRLLGAYLSADASLQSLQPLLLSYTLKDLSAALVELDPPAILDVLQTEIFLAHYFFSSNRTVEGVYHMDAASAIVLAHRLHKVRSTHYPRTLPSRDDIEECERINAFWSTFILDRCWSPILSRAPILTDAEVRGTEIDTPWPLSIEAYENHPLPAEWRGFQTVQRFLFDAHFSNIEQSPLALHAKAATLYSQARRIADQFNTYITPLGWAELDRRIGQFIQSLPSLESVQPGDRHLQSTLLVVYTLACGAVIALQEPLLHHSVGTTKAVSAAFDAVNVLNRVDVRGVCVDPMVGAVLVAVANVVVRTLRLRRQSASGEANGIRMALARIRFALGVWGERSAYIKDQECRVAAMLEGV